MKTLMQTVGLAALCLATSAVAPAAKAQEPAFYNPPAFGNYYTDGSGNQTVAPLYVSPLPVPQWVGHTYITYQPFYPHEFTHRHGHRYHNYYDNGRGLNRTAVRYSVGPFGAIGRGIVKKLSRPRP
ncbi:MAG: hypothetical protein D6753_03870 [Planctomycetota bacterium]|nr:MAG: hypothetical protein D6753_03870 [Planctomycetota bacterium]